jgi:hypothetical protein
MSFLFTMIWGACVFAGDAYAVWLLWGWHGVSVGLPAITVWRAAGLSALWNIFALRVRTDEAQSFVDALDTEQDAVRKEHGARVERWRRFLYVVMVLSVVFFGWIAKLLAG